MRMRSVSGRARRAAAAAAAASEATWPGQSRHSADIKGCVHKVVQSDAGSDIQITGFQTTFTNALCNKSWLLNWQVTDLTSVINLLQRPEWY